MKIVRYHKKPGMPDEGLGDLLSRGADVDEQRRVVGDKPGGGFSDQPLVWMRDVLAGLVERFSTPEATIAPP